MYHASFFKKAIPHYKKGVELHLVANHTAALKYFELAEKSKYPPAIYMLYLYFSESNNVFNLPYLENADALAKHYFTSLRHTSSWFKDSADSGNNDAQFILARLYSDQYFQQNSHLEQFYLNEAAIGGSLSAKAKLIEMDYDKHNAFRQCLNLVSDFSDFATAHYLLANMYEEGSGVTKNMSLAIEEHQKAAQLGHINSAYRYYLLNKQIGNKPEHAEKFCFKAAQANHFLAQITYNNLYYKIDVSEEINNLLFPSRWRKQLSSSDFESIWPQWKRKQVAELIKEQTSWIQIAPSFPPFGTDMLPPPYSTLEMSAPPPPKVGKSLPPYHHCG